MEDAEESRLKKDRLFLIEGDLLTFPTLPEFSERKTQKMDLIICMGDTLTHLASLAEVSTLFKQCFDALDKGGSLVLQFRDLCNELYDGDRFIPVKSDERTVFTCFLEWTRDGEQDEKFKHLLFDGSGRIIKVHDLVHVKKGIGAWELCTSWYKKLAISPASCTWLLESVGFKDTTHTLCSDGMLLFKASV